jgi:hypothetical protein
VSCFESAMFTPSEDDYWSHKSHIGHRDWVAAAYAIEQMLKVNGSVEVPKGHMTEIEAGWVTSRMNTRYRYDSTPTDHVWTLENGEAS